MPRLVCYYHAVWATKHRATIITSSLEEVIFTTIRKISLEINSPIYALNGWTDHIHVAVQIYHTLALSEWVKRVKGASGRAVNVGFPDLEIAFGWQVGYSIQTLGYERLAGVVSYIEQQKIHHRDQTLLPALEQLDEE